MLLNCHWNEIFVSSFIRPIYSLKRAYNRSEHFLGQILKESVVFKCPNRVSGAKLFPGSGTEFKDAVTSLVVYTQEAR